MDSRPVPELAPTLIVEWSSACQSQDRIKHTGILEEVESNQAPSVLNPARMSRSHHCDQRIFPALHSEIVLCVLSRFPQSPGAEQGFTRNQRSPATRQGHRRRDSTSWRASSSLRATRSRIALFWTLSNGLTQEINELTRPLTLNPQLPVRYFFRVGFVEFSNPGSRQRLAWLRRNPPGSNFREGQPFLAPTPHYYPVSSLGVRCRCWTGARRDYCSTRIVVIRCGCALLPAPSSRVAGVMLCTRTLSNAGGCTTNRLS
jgi:hypothetical protein